jgi:hypothetical protein
MPKTSIGPNGFMAQFSDTKRNKIGISFYEIKIGIAYKRKQTLNIFFFSLKKKMPICNR